MSTSAVAAEQGDLFANLAREIATNVYPLDTILNHFQISPREWQAINDNPTFQRYLSIAVQEWNSVTSTNQRIKLKMMIAIEHALPELVRQLMVNDEPLASRAKLLELMMRGSEIGVVKNSDGTTAGSVQITINLGADKQLSVEASLPKQVNQAPVIEHDIEDLLA